MRRAPGGWLLERLATIPLVFPGLVLGIAVMQLFLHLPIPLYGTLGFLIWAFVINYLPYGMRYSAVRHAADPSRARGGGRDLRRLAVDAPAPDRGAAARAGAARGLAVHFPDGDARLSLAILLAGPRSQTMAVAMFDLWGNGQGTELAALGLMWSMLMAMIAVVFYLLARRYAAGALARA